MTQTAYTGTSLTLVLGAAGLLMVPDRIRLPRSAKTSRSVAAGSTQARRAVLAAFAIGVAGTFLVPGLWWVVVPGAVVVGVLLARRPVGRTAAQRATDRRLVAVYAELLASCLDAGMAVGAALRAVSEVLAERGPPRTPGAALPGPDPEAAATIGADSAGPLTVLDRVAAMLSLGADPETAWRVADLDDDLAPIGAAARRSAAGGGGLADAVREHAAQLRQETAAASVRSAGRAGVLMTAPLGLCFLPAFLCLGLAPVVVGLLGQLHIF